MRAGCKEDTERTRQAARWGADRLAEERRGKEFIKLHGLGHNFLNQVRQHKDPPASVLIAMARFFNMSLDEFIEEAWAHRESKDEEEEEGGLVKPKKPPEIAVKILTRFPVAPCAEGDTLIAPALLKLDDLRYQNPVTSLNRLWRIVDSLPREQLAYAANVATSCFRMTLNFADSFFCADLGRNLANSTKNVLALGDNCQRWVFLYSDIGYHHAALASSRASSDYFMSTGSLMKLGESVVDRAFCFDKQKDYVQVLRHCRSAEAFAAELSDRNNLARLHLEAIAQLNLGSVRKALKISRRSFAMANDPLSKGKSLWLSGKIEGSLGNFKVAERLIGSASDVLSPEYPMEALLAHLDLAKIGLSLGLPVDLSVLSSYLPKFECIPALRVAIEEIIALWKLQKLEEPSLGMFTSRIKKVRGGFFAATAKS